MNDLPINRPGRPEMDGRPNTAPDDMHPSHDFRREAGSIRGRIDSRPVGLGSAIGFFVALLFLFVMAAAVAQFAVRGDRSVGDAPAAPPVTQDQTPAQPSPAADGNPVGSTSRDAVTP